MGCSNSKMLDEKTNYALDEVNNLTHDDTMTPSRKLLLEKYAMQGASGLSDDSPSFAANHTIINPRERHDSVMMPDHRTLAMSPEVLKKTVIADLEKNKKTVIAQLDKNKIEAIANIDEIKKSVIVDLDKSKESISSDIDHKKNHVVSVIADIDQSKKTVIENLDSGKKAVIADIAEIDKNKKTTIAELEKLKKSLIEDLEKSKKASIVEMDKNRKRVIADLEENAKCVMTDFDLKKKAAINDLDIIQKVLVDDIDKRKITLMTDIDNKKNHVVSVIADIDQSKKTVIENLDSGKKAIIADIVDMDKNKKTTIAELEKLKKTAISDIDKSKKTAISDIDQNKKIVISDLDKNKKNVITEIDKNTKTVGGLTCESKRKVFIDADRISQSPPNMGHSFTSSKVYVEQSNMTPRTYIDQSNTSPITTIDQSNISPRTYIDQGVTSPRIYGHSNVSPKDYIHQSNTSPRTHMSQSNRSVSPSSDKRSISPDINCNKKTAMDVADHISQNTNISQSPNRDSFDIDHYYLSGKYMLGGPKMEGEVKALFKTGLLYRITGNNKYSYYNDTPNYEMHITSDDYKLVLYPGENSEPINGDYTDVTWSFTVKPLSHEYRKKIFGVADKKVQDELAAIRKHTYSDDPEEVLRECVKNNIMYVDNDFEPCQDSMSRQHDRKKFPLQAWQRPQEYLPKDLHDKIKAFRHISPNDIDQGLLGDCWLMSAIAATAERPKRIEKIFQHPKGAYEETNENRVGAFRCTMNKHGWWTSIILDSYLPVVGGKPCFAKNIEDPSEMWVSLIEKAYAKLHGSYASITGGCALQAMTDLTGFPMYRFDADWITAQKSELNSYVLFDKMVTYDQEHYLMNLNTPGYDKSYTAAQDVKGAAGQKYHEIGLSMGHAYSALEVKYFPDNNLRLVKIRNPWGNGHEWTGAWSNASSLWKHYPDVARACRYSEEADGTFWMDFKDALKYFDGGGVCFYKNDWFDYRIKGQFIGSAATVALEITVTKPVQMFVILSQKDKRGLHAKDVDSDYTPILLSVCKKNGKRHVVDFSTSCDASAPSKAFNFSFAREHAMLYTFMPDHGPYLVIPRIHVFNDSVADSKDYTLGLISEAMVGDGVTVKFKALPQDCKVFANHLKFMYDSDEAPDKYTEFQHTPNNGTPVNKRGAMIE